jgi:hypothetical protein
LLRAVEESGCGDLQIKIARKTQIPSIRHNMHAIRQLMQKTEIKRQKKKAAKKERNGQNQCKESHGSLLSTTK